MPGMSAHSPDVGLELAAQRALLERVLGELLELRAEVRAQHRGRQGLERGRDAAIRAAQARAAYKRVMVVELAAADVQAGHPDRGRAKRIALSLAGKLSESQVRRILRILSSARDSRPQDAGSKGDG